MKKDFGFTLVELLVAISIVAILSTAGVTMFTMATKNARDQKRLQDLWTIKQALELYRNDNHEYPSSTWIATQPLRNPDASKTYLNPVPADPNSDWNYAYQLTSAGFVLCAKKEGNISDPAPDECNVSCGTETCDIGISSD